METVSLEPLPLATWRAYYMTDQTYPGEVMTQTHLIFAEDMTS